MANSPPTRLLLATSPDHTLVSRDQIPLSQRRELRDAPMVAPVGSVGPSSAHAHADSRADKHGPRGITAHEWRPRVRCGRAQPDSQVHTRLSVSISNWTEHKRPRVKLPSHICLPQYCHDHLKPATGDESLPVPWAMPLHAETTPHVRPQWVYYQAQVSSSGITQPSRIQARSCAIASMRVLVIGGTRFVGYQLVWRLLAAGHRVTLVNRGLRDDPFGTRVERIIVDRASERATQLLATRRFEYALKSVWGLGPLGRRTDSL